MKIRVLIVVDYYGWICARMAKNILACSRSSNIVCSIVSLSVLHRTFSTHRELYASFHVVHFFAQYFTKDFIESFRSLGVATISTLHHSTDWEEEIHCLNTDYIVTVSCQWTEWLKKLEPSVSSRLFEYSNSCNSNLFRPFSVSSKTKLRKQHKIKKDTIVVGFFANATSNNSLEDRKGTSMFVSALRMLAKKHPVTVVISGIGWTSIINELLTEGINVCRLNYATTQREMVNRFNLLDFYWITSKIEGGPVTLLEALSCGIPCFSTPVGLALNISKAADIITIINHGDATSLASSTFQLFIDKSEYVKRSHLGRRLISSFYDTKSVVPPILSFYSDIASLENTSSMHTPPPGWIFEALECKCWFLHLLAKKHYSESLYYCWLWLIKSLFTYISRS